MKSRFVKYTNTGAVLVVGAHKDTSDCTEIEVADADWQDAGSPSWWVDDKGVIRKPTTLEKLEREEALARALAATKLKNARDIALMSVVVDIDGNDIWANPTEEQNISGRIRQMDADGLSECKWIQGLDVYVLTKAQLEAVWLSGTTQCAQIYDDYITAVEAL